MMYFDYASTTPVDPKVAQAMSSCLMLGGAYGNPASVHALGWQGREAVEKARRQVAKAVGASPMEIVWTSGATESDNLAILASCARRYQRDRSLAYQHHRAQSGHRCCKAD